ncbi:alpha/beta hydrolase family protein [Ceratobasidium sp. AG-Ba]|nr:alpha/beta hydrolase family protein [Ceratobasidium sp. AG-Ba]
MVRLNKCLSGAMLLLSMNPQAAFARLINTTIFDTNSAYITYEPREDFCARWTNGWWSSKSCEIWAQPWSSEVYYNNGRLTGVHRSLSHQLASMSIEFNGSAIWLYGPPRAQVAVTPPDYKICIRQAHPMALNEACYRMDVTKAYLAAERYNDPVVIFAKGGLQYQSHRVIVSVANPTGDPRKHFGIQFSHAVYTIERPTPWPHYRKCRDLT